MCKTFEGDCMKRFTIFLLIGATMTIAQTDSDNTEVNEIEILTKELHKKLRVTLENVDVEAYQAKIEAHELKLKINGITYEEKMQLLLQRRVKVKKRLQEAIATLEETSEIISAQVEEIKERLQERIEERLQKRKNELIELKQRIRVHEEWRRDGEEAEDANASEESLGIHFTDKL